LVQQPFVQVSSSQYRLPSHHVFLRQKEEGWTESMIRDGTNWCKVCEAGCPSRHQPVLDIHWIQPFFDHKQTYQGTDVAPFCVSTLHLHMNLTSVLVKIMRVHILLLHTNFIAEGRRPWTMTTPVHSTALLTYSTADNPVQSLMSSNQRLLGLPRPLSPPT